MLPIFFGVFGGLISYFAIRSDDPGKARNNLYLGIALTAAETVVHVVFFGFDRVVVRRASGTQLPSDRMVAYWTLLSVRAIK